MERPHGLSHSDHEAKVRQRNLDPTAESPRIRLRQIVVQRLRRRCIMSLDRSIVLRLSQGSLIGTLIASPATGLCMTRVVHLHLRCDVNRRSGWSRTCRHGTRLLTASPSTSAGHRILTAQDRSRSQDRHKTNLLDEM